MDGISEHGGSVILDAVDEGSGEPLVRRSEVEAAFQQRVEKVVSGILDELQADINRQWYPGQDAVSTSHVLEFKSSVVIRQMHGFIRNNETNFKDALSRRLEGFDVCELQLAPHVPAEVDGQTFTVHLTVKPA